MSETINNQQLEEKIHQNENQESHQLLNNQSMSQQNPFQNLDQLSELHSSVKQNEQLDEDQDQDQQNQNQLQPKAEAKKSKKQRKKQKKMRKINAAKAKKQHKKQNIDQNIQSYHRKPGKKMALDSQDQMQTPNNKSSQQIQIKPKSSKKQKNKKQKVKNNEEENQQNLNKQQQSVSEDYSSEQLLSSEDQGLFNLNPNQNQQNQGRSFKKRLGKKSRKQRILEKEGLDLRELGNDADVNYQLNGQEGNSSDDSYSQGGRRKKGKRKDRKNKQKKQKKQKLTNQQLFDKFKQLGCQQQIQQNESARYNYDSGIQQIQKIKSKKQSKNTIKMQNRMFQNLQVQLQKQINDQQQGQNQQIPPPQTLQLNFKPKSSINSSRAGSFLNKVQAIKKNRGLQADINEEQFQKITKQKAKRSISQLVQRIQIQVEDNQQIDIEIKAPAIAKGKSADLINNTMFMVRSLNQKNSGHQSQNVNNSIQSSINLTQQNKEKNQLSNQNGQKSTKTPTTNIQQKSRKGVSRTQFFKQIKQSISVRRSKQVSTEQLKNSFKSSKLEELEQIRKKIESKRKKEAMFQLGDIDEDDADVVINQLQEQLAKNNGMSRDDYKRLLRQQDGLQQLGEYQQIQEKKIKKKKNQQQNQLNDEEKQQQCKDGNKNQNTDKINNNQQDNQQENIQQRRQKNSLDNKKLQQKSKALQPNKQLKKNQKLDSNKQQQVHADDMIQQFQGIQAQQQNQMDDQINQQQMQIENQEEIQSQLEDNQDQEQQENQQNEQQNQQQAQEQQLDGNQKIDQQINGQEKIIGHTQKNKQEEKQLLEKQKLLQQLQDEGIVMPGANKKKYIKTYAEDIDMDQYIIQKPIKPNPQQNQSDKSNNSKVSSNSYKLEQNKNTQNLSNKAQTKEEQTLQFKQFRKLRKIAVVIQQKKKKRQQQLKRAKQYFQQEAQLGSDNQQNDDNVKNINKKQDDDEYDGQDLDVELQELIDNAVDINQANQQEAFKKYMQDVKQQDRQQLQKILRGQFRKPNHDMPQMQMQQDQKNRIQRMQKMVQWMKKKQEQDQNGMYANQQEESDDQKNYYYDFKGNRKRIVDKKHKSREQDEQETPQQDPQTIERKLQYYLMDAISPAKKDHDIQLNSQLVTQLPTMNRKNTKTLLANADKKSQLQNTQQSLNNSGQKPKPVTSIFGFTGSLMNLGANKSDKSQFSMPKVKKITSHMSQYLNKTKVQKRPTNGGPISKLPVMFGRVISSKK